MPRATGATRPVRGRRDAESTRRSLLAAATKHFARDGFAGASVDRIAREARVNKALVSYHFGGKAALYRSILLTTFREMNRRIDRADDPAAPAEGRLGLVFDTFAGLAEETPEFPAMILREVLSGGHHLDEEVLPEFLALFARIRRVVTDGVREGSFRPVDPLLTHLSIVGSLVFFFATQPLRRRLAEEGRIPAQAPTAGEFVRHSRALVARGIAASPDPGGK